MTTVPYERPGAIFTSVPASYAAHRPPYPKPVVDYVDMLLRTGGQSRYTPNVAELGCGPGTFTLPLAARGIAVEASDANADMIEQARIAHADHGHGVTVAWRHADALTALNAHNMVGLDGFVVADAFHWMPREEVLDAAAANTLKHSVFITVDSMADGSARPWWLDAAEQLRQQFPGNTAAAGPGQTWHRQIGTHGQVMLGSDFKHVRHWTMPYVRRATVAQVVGELTTYPAFSAAALGKHYDQFVSELRRSLMYAAGGKGIGPLSARVTYEVYSGHLTQD